MVQLVDATRLFERLCWTVAAVCLLPYALSTGASAWHAAFGASGDERAAHTPGLSQQEADIAGFSDTDEESACAPLGKAPRRQPAPECVSAQEELVGWRAGYAVRVPYQPPSRMRRDDI
jgi:hypothetical protein